MSTDPGDGTQSWQTSRRSAVQQRNINSLTGAPQLIDGVEPRDSFESLCVPCFDRFHERGHLCRNKIDTFALRGRKTSRRWPNGDDHWKADAIKAGDVGKSRNAHQRHQRFMRRERLFRCAGPMRRLSERLRNGGTFDAIKHV
jgi:hypothetical protein